MKIFETSFFCCFDCLFMEGLFLYSPMYKHQLLTRTKEVREVQTTVKILNFYLYSQLHWCISFQSMLKKKKSASNVFVGFLLKVIGIALCLIIAIKGNYNLCLFESWNIWASKSYYLLLYNWMRWSAKETGNLNMVFIIILPTLSKSIVILVFLLFS